MHPFQPRTENAVPPQFATYGPTSPPPIIQVSMAEHRVQVNPPLARTSAQTPPMLPSYSVTAPSQPRTMAQQEKDDCYARSASPSYVAYAAEKPTTRAVAPAPILLPPKAAFAHSESPLQSPVSLRQAQEFGDAGSIRSGTGTGTGLLVGGRGGADVRKSGVDWSRFSVLVSASDRGEKSEWLERKQGASRKWVVAGWIAAVLLVVAIVVGIVVGVKNRSDGGDGAPKIADLGIFNSKVIHSSSTSREPSAISTISTRTSSSTSSPSSQGGPALSETTTADEQIEPTSVSVADVTTTLSTTVAVESTRSSARIARSSTTTPSVSSSSVAVPPRSTTALSTQTTITSQSTSSSSTTTTVSRATGVHRRRFLNHASFEALRASFAGDAFGRVKRDGSSVGQ